MSALIGLSSGA
uniref:Uncharacterized protein LOC104265777 n=1 Tax=Phallusia mammillata TaxID=59560 RepID=A0A6F9DJL2_9ASCI|nr:uncharacterized protein LOC104265777 [Phallusia mammillata]